MTAGKEKPAGGGGGLIRNRLAGRQGKYVKDKKGSTTMSKQTRKGKPMPWFKCWFFQWDTDEVAALDLETTAFLHLLKLRMAERRSPLPEEFLPHVARGKRLNRRSIERMLKTLVGYGLIVREAGLIWNEDIADDIDGFFDVSQKFDQSFAKVSPEQRQKTQQNQSNASTEVEEEKEGDREAPQGASQYQVEKENLDSREPALAGASRSPSAEEREDFTAGDPSFDGREDFSAGDPPTADEANSVFAEAFEALCRSGDDLSVVGQDGQRDTAEPQPAAGQNRTADAAASDEKRVRRMIDLCAERDDDLSMKDSVFIARLEGRDASSFTPDDIRRLANIVNALPEQEKSGVYFGDDADEEAHAGVPF